MSPLSVLTLVKDRPEHFRQLLEGLGRSSVPAAELVVVDPPSFASRQSQVPGALSAYRRLARLGLVAALVGSTAAFVAVPMAQASVETSRDLVTLRLQHGELN